MHILRPAIRSIPGLILAVWSASSFAQTFTVNDAADPQVVDVAGCLPGGSSCTLRAAVVAAEQTPGHDRVEFDGTVTPTLNRPLHAVQPLTIDGGAGKTIVQIDQGYQMIEAEPGVFVLHPDFTDPNPNGYGTGLVSLLGSGSVVRNLELSGSLSLDPGDPTPTYVQLSIGPRPVDLDGSSVIVAKGGIYVDNGASPVPAQVTVTGNVLAHFSGAAILLLNTENALVDSNSISLGNNKGDGIVVFGSPNGTKILGNAVSGHRNGISIVYAADPEVSGNLLAGNRTGLELEQVRGATVNDNLIDANHATGIVMRLAELSLIQGNTISRNGSYAFGQGGMDLSGADRIQIVDNDFEDNRGAGLFISGFSGSVGRSDVRANRLSGNVNGVFMFPAQPLLQNSITDNTIGSSVANGILNFGLFGDNYNLTVGANTVTGSGSAGISFIGGGSDLVLDGNTLDQGETGMFVASKFFDGQNRVDGELANITVSRNKVRQNSGTGLIVVDVTAVETNIVSGNEIVGNGGGLAFLAATSFDITDNDISANQSSGLAILEGSAGFDVSANRVGITPDGDDVGNGGTGIYVGAFVSVYNFGYPADLLDLAGPTDIHVDRNSIAFNASAGILVGSDIDGTIQYFCGLPNVPCGATPPGAYLENGAATVSITDNTVFANDEAGIDLSSASEFVPADAQSFVRTTTDGANPNDPNDHDGFESANEFQNFPVLRSVRRQGDHVNVKLTLDTRPGVYRIDFFADDHVRAGGVADARYRLGHAFVSTSQTECDEDIPSVNGTIVLREESSTDSFEMLSELSAAFVTATATKMVFDDNCEMVPQETSELGSAMLLD